MGRGEGGSAGRRRWPALQKAIVQRALRRCGSQRMPCLAPATLALGMMKHIQRALTHSLTLSYDTGLSRRICTAGTCHPCGAWVPITPPAHAQGCGTCVAVQQGCDSVQPPTLSANTASWLSVAASQQAGTHAWTHAPVPAGATRPCQLKCKVCVASAKNACQQLPSLDTPGGLKVHHCLPHIRGL